MNDPYQVLGIPRDADGAQIKKAYRELARKYHPDNYHESPLEDMAQEKMKAINAAYEQIRQERGIQSPAGRSESAAGGTQGQPRRPQPPGGGRREVLLFQVRQAIFMGELNLAEALLNAYPARPAEWYFLRGNVAFRRGWMDEAAQNYLIACRIDPGNAEYRRAVEYMETGPGRAYCPRPDRRRELLHCGFRLIRCSLCACGTYSCCLYDAMLRTYTNDTLSTLLCGNGCGL